MHIRALPKTVCSVGLLDTGRTLENTSISPEVLGLKLCKWKVLIKLYVPFQKKKKTLCRKFKLST